MLATSLGVYIIGRAATADALLNLLIAASMFGAWLHLDTGRRGWLYATFAAIGLGFLAKGPVAILVPLAVTFLFCLLRRDLQTWARAVFDWRGLLLFAVIAAPWYAIIFAKEGWAFFEGFFLRHNLGRFGGPLQGHAGSLVYYFPHRARVDAAVHRAAGTGCAAPADDLARRPAALSAAVVRRSCSCSSRCRAPSCRTTCCTA